MKQFDGTGLMPYPAEVILTNGETKITVLCFNVEEQLMKLLIDPV